MRKRIASVGVDQTVQVWDAFTSHLDFTYRGHVEQKPTSTVQDIAWSPDGRRIVSVSDAANQGVQVWDATNGGHRYLFTGHLDKVGTVCWSPDGQYIATGSADVLDSTVQVWRDQTGIGS